MKHSHSESRERTWWHDMRTSAPPTGLISTIIQFLKLWLRLNSYLKDSGPRWQLCSLGGSREQEETTLLSSSSCSPKAHISSYRLSAMPLPPFRAGNLHSFTHKQGTLPAASQPADFDCINLFRSGFSSWAWRRSQLIKTHFSPHYRIKTN